MGGRTARHEERDEKSEGENCWIFITRSYPNASNWRIIESGEKFSLLFSVTNNVIMRLARWSVLQDSLISQSPGPLSQVKHSFFCDRQILFNQRTSTIESREHAAATIRPSPSTWTSENDTTHAVSAIRMKKRIKYHETTYYLTLIAKLAKWRGKLMKLCHGNHVHTWYFCSVEESRCQKRLWMIKNFRNMWYTLNIGSSQYMWSFFEVANCSVDRLTQGGS